MIFPNVRWGEFLRPVTFIQTLALIGWWYIPFSADAGEPMNLVPDRESIYEEIVGDVEKAVDDLVGTQEEFNALRSRLIAAHDAANTIRVRGNAVCGRFDNEAECLTYHEYAAIGVAFSGYESEQAIGDALAEALEPLEELWPDDPAK